MGRRLRLASTLGALAVWLLACGGDGDHGLALVGVRVVPMTGTGVLEDQTVLVQEGRIRALGPRDRIRIPLRSQRIDARGQVLLPGLLDMHVHLTSRRALRRRLADGVTTVRNMRGEPLHLRWRDAVVEGRLLGPRIVTAGPVLDGRGSRLAAAVEVETPEEARRAVLAQAEAGYDFIKVYDGLSRASYAALMQAARDVGLPVAGHVPRAVGFEAALRAGQRSIEHSEALAGQSAESVRRLAQLSAREGVWLCPTLALDRFFGSPPLRRRSLGQVSRFHAAGGALLVGTDTRPDLLIAELEALVRAGLTPFEALAAATRDAARFLGRHDLGQVAVGATADLILVAGDPLQDLGALSRVEGMVLGGRWLSSRRLERLASAP